MTYRSFLEESNRIEGIIAGPLPTQVDRFVWFLGCPTITVEILSDLVRVFQPNARLRDRPGLDVRVGDHYPPPGGPGIRYALDSILRGVDDHSQSPWHIHLAFETLHPFTDGNGRAGRMLWAWMMQSFPLGFLHHFYYQTLQHAGKTPSIGSDPPSIARIEHEDRVERCRKISPILFPAGEYRASGAENPHTPPTFKRKLMD